MTRTLMVMLRVRAKEEIGSERDSLRRFIEGRD